MQKKYKKQKGFTLIEMLIAISVFSIFITSVVTAYLDIAKSQRHANSIRGIYSETRYVFNLISDEVRSKTIDYSCYSGAENNPERRDEFGICNELVVSGDKYLALINSEGTQRTVFKVKKNDGKNSLYMYKEIRDLGQTEWIPDGDAYRTDYVEIPFNNLELESFGFDINPIVDPYDIENVFCDEVQLQPSVTIFTSVNGISGTEAERFHMDLQTTVSSRVYNRQTTLT